MRAHLPVYPEAAVSGRITEYHRLRAETLLLRIDGNFVDQRYRLWFTRLDGSNRGAVIIETTDFRRYCAAVRLAIGKLDFRKAAGL